MPGEVRALTVGPPPTLNPLRSRLSFFLPAVLLLAGDVATKLAVYRTLSLSRGPIPVLGEWIRLNYVHNPDAAFGLFHGSRWFFIGVSTLSILVILALAVGRRYQDLWMRLALGLILGGAVGNLLDRIWLGVVIDFLDVGLGAHRWPIFNVADCGVTVGVILLGLRLLSEGRAEDHATGLDGEAETGHGG